MVVMVELLELGQLIRVQHPFDLLGGGLEDRFELRVLLVLAQARVRVEGFKVRRFRIQHRFDFLLLTGSETELFSQMGQDLIRIKRTMVTPVVRSISLRRRRRRAGGGGWGGLGQSQSRE